MAEALLVIEKLEAGYGEVQVLWGVSLQALRGKLTAIVGANGAGKTTMLRAIAGTIVPWGGRVTFEGRDVTRVATNVKAAQGFSLVPEGRQLFGAMTVDENLELGAFSKRAARNYTPRLERVFALFPRLAERRRQLANTLSGGEQQMLAIARALMMEPRLLVLDEPSFGLAPRVVEDIFKIVERIKKEESVSVLLVEQNANLALELADHGYLLETGYVVASGSAKALADDPQIRRAYLGY